MNSDQVQAYMFSHRWSKKGFTVSSLTHKIPIWVIGALVIVGTTVVEWFLTDPLHGNALVNQVIRGNLMAGVLGILFLGVPIVLGWLHLMLSKDQLKPRLHWFWTPFGLLMFAWALSTFYGATVIEDSIPITAEVLLTTSPEVWRSAATGLLFAFYSLESASPLWYFYWFWFIAGALTQGPAMLVFDLLPVLFPSLGFLRYSWSPYLDPAQAGKFWHYWGFFFLDCYFIPLGLVAGYYIVKWRKGILEKEGERHALLWGFLQGLGLPLVLLRQSLKGASKD